MGILTGIAECQIHVQIPEFTGFQIKLLPHNGVSLTSGQEHIHHKLLKDLILKSPFAFRRTEDFLRRVLPVQVVFSHTAAQIKIGRAVHAADNSVIFRLQHLTSCRTLRFKCGQNNVHVGFPKLCSLLIECRLFYEIGLSLGSKCIHQEFPEGFLTHGFCIPVAAAGACGILVLCRDTDAAVVGVGRGNDPADKHEHQQDTQHIDESACFHMYISFISMADCQYLQLSDFYYSTQFMTFP